MPDDSAPASTDRQIRRSAERLGFAVPCRCACAHEERGHRHECIAGQGHNGFHRCYCGAWFERREGDNA